MAIVMSRIMGVSSTEKEEENIFIHNKINAIFSYLKYSVEI